MTRHHRGRISRLVALSIALACALAALPASAEHIKIGVIRVMASGPVFLAQDKGYFAAEGLDAEIVFFGAAQNVALATVAGMIPLALAFGAGSQLLQPLAIAVIGGVLASLPLSLIVTPVVHYALSSKKATATV